MIEYCIVEEVSYAAGDKSVGVRLSSRVNEMIATGWLPKGELIITNQTVPPDNDIVGSTCACTCISYSQVMIKGDL